jgi:hypothetical protein
MIGDWLIGSHFDNSDHFMMNKIGAAQPQFLIRVDAQIWAGSEETFLSPSCQLTAAVPCSLPAPQQAWRFGVDSFGPWAVGDKNRTMIFQAIALGRPTLILSDDVHMIGGLISGGAPQSWSHLAASARVLRLGNW